MILQPIDSKIIIGVLVNKQFEISRHSRTIYVPFGWGILVTDKFSHHISSRSIKFAF